MSIQTSAMKRSAYLAAGGFDEMLPSREDTHLFFKLGLQTPVCAVSGVGGLLSEATVDSLTTIHSTADVTYWRSTALLYEDVLNMGRGRLDAADRKILSRRLADAHWMLAKRSGRTSPGRAFRHLRASLRADPSHLPRRVATRVARRGRGLTLGRG
jgi:hypothetical protein